MTTLPVTIGKNKSSVVIIFSSCSAITAVSVALGRNMSSVVIMGGSCKRSVGTVSNFREEQIFNPVIEGCISAMYQSKLE